MRLVAAVVARLLTCLAGAECVYIDHTQVQSRRKQWWNLSRTMRQFRTRFSLAFFVHSKFFLRRTRARARFYLCVRVFVHGMLPISGGLMHLPMRSASTLRCSHIASMVLIS